MHKHPHPLPAFTFVNVLAVIAFAFIMVMSLAKEPTQQELNAILILALWFFLGALSVFNLFRKQKIVTA